MTAERPGARRGRARRVTNRRGPSADAPSRGRTAGTRPSPRHRESPVQITGNITACDVRTASVCQLGPTTFVGFDAQRDPRTIDGVGVVAKRVLGGASLSLSPLCLLLVEWLRRAARSRRTRRASSCACRCCSNATRCRSNVQLLLCDGGGRRCVLHGRPSNTLLLARSVDHTEGADSERLTN